jgi:hypothetical protein
MRTGGVRTQYSFQFDMTEKNGAALLDPMTLSPGELHPAFRQIF